eukprot:TRINITY_DN23289_c0_g1_i2.p1 TRINITY_DN23289_c0_g1~~TRINITY_DN23289_c0_g1_i2.p1  ORF type:complete len:364 (+),score=51.62 TRINITY_DN23289_c0_g1_i2:173-1264(+)
MPARTDPQTGKRVWYRPDRIEDLYTATSDNTFITINAPTAGPRQQQALKLGDENNKEAQPAALQLYSLSTPNGWKVGMMLEEMGVPYDAHVINIRFPEDITPLTLRDLAKAGLKCRRFFLADFGHHTSPSIHADTESDWLELLLAVLPTSGFVGVTPNSKIPALLDLDGVGDGKPLAIMEGAAIMMHLGAKYPEHNLLPADPRLRSECLQWLFFQVGSQGPMTGNFGHFLVYAPEDAIEARDYGVARYGMDVQRLAHVLERHLAGYGDFQGSCEMRPEGARSYLVGDAYSIADMACWPWVQALVGKGYNREGQAPSREFMRVNRYPNLLAWHKRILDKPSTYRGMRVCSNGKTKPWLLKQSKL